MVVVCSEYQNHVLDDGTKIGKLIPPGMRTNSQTAILPTSSVEKALELLFHLHEQGEPQGATAIGEALDLPKSSAHRLAQTLSRRGLLEQDARGRYRPGFALVALGLGVLEADPVVPAARTELAAEAAALGETVFLTAARQGGIVVLDKAEGTGFLRAAPQVGSRVPVHATAVGKLYLAFAPDQVDAGPALEVFTPRTAVDREALARAVEQARRDGWSENREEWIPGLSVVAAPVRPAGRMVGAIAMAGPTQRMDELGAERVARRMVEAAERVAARLAGGRRQ
jgi:IclR family acetate operon transcriptional repressor